MDHFRRGRKETNGSYRNLCRSRCFKRYPGYHEHPLLQAKNFSNNEADINKAVTYVKKLAPVLVVMEATGGLEMPLAAALSAAEIPVAECSMGGTGSVLAFAGGTSRAG